MTTTVRFLLLVATALSSADAKLRGAADRQRDLYGLEYGVEGFQALQGDAEDQPDKFQINPNTPEDLGYVAGIDVDAHGANVDPFMGGFVEGESTNDGDDAEQGDNEYDTKIVNGKLSTHHQQGMVMLLKQIGTSSSTGNPIWNNVGCGGALISGCHVVTAKHCLVGSLSGQTKAVYIGAMAPWKSNNSKPKSIVRVSKIYFTHNSYSEFHDYSLDNDIAILKLAECVSTNYLAPMEVATSSDIQRLESSSSVVYGTVMGFGKESSSSGYLSKELQDTEVPFVKTNTCQQYYKNYSRQVKDDQHCAGAGSHDACQGDSGGPMVMNPYAKSPTLIGVVSWGNGCALANYPGVYTDPSMHYEWMKAVVAEDSRIVEAKNNGWYRTNFLNSAISEYETSRGGSQPQPQPTRRPTPSPTRRPTPQPTRRPNPSPTRRPTPQPTRRPNPSPTPAPVTATTDSGRCEAFGGFCLKDSDCCSGRCRTWTNRCK